MPAGRQRYDHAVKAGRYFYGGFRLIEEKLRGEA
jgi:hypothetical protein